MRTLWLALIAVFASVTIGLADAEAQKRLGGGKNIGKQAPSNVIQRDATPPASPGAAPSAPGGASAASGAPSAPAAATAARPGAAAAPAAAGSRWMAPLAGIAAGLGLAALASWMGFGEELATILLIALVAVVVLVAVRMVMARRAGAGRQPAYAGGAQYSGLGQEASVPRQPMGVPAAPSAPAAAAVAPAAVAPEALADLPAGFDVDGFVRHAKVYFVRLQAAFDAGDTDDLREFTSPEMFAELKMQIDERQGASNQTDVVSLDARLLGVETVGNDWLASVRFSGLLREQPGAAPEPFDEVWNFARPVEGKGGWVLGGIQQLSRA